MRRDIFLKSMLAAAAAGSLPLSAFAGAALKMMIPANPGGGWDGTGRALGKALIESKAPQAKDFTNQRVSRGGIVDEVERAKNKSKSKVRARVEHVFAVVKRLWGFNKVRYRGLVKNATRAFVALGLGNIYLARARLAA